MATNRKEYFVVGWLVCIDGPDLGHSFSLYYGYNAIGNSRSNAVSLFEDESVASGVHCSVVYEDRKNQFFLLPEADNAVLINNVPISEAVKLQSGDILGLGKSRLEFIAFCRGNRKWEREAFREWEGSCESGLRRNAD